MNIILISMNIITSIPKHSARTTTCLTESGVTGLVIPVLCDECTGEGTRFTSTVRLNLIYKILFMNIILFTLDNAFVNNKTIIFT